MCKNSIIKSDLIRYGGELTCYLKRFHRLFRKTQSSECKIVKNFYRLLYVLHCRKHGIEISSKTQIGKGLYLCHPYCITVNGQSKIGDNVNLHKGVTIGTENRGKRKGSPVIGNNVWIGINATVVGNITIGDDVLIAPNSFVNCDIPSHSVVFGNPCVIKPCENATESYIINKA